ncbi:MAG: hypothetical protein DVS81_04500 [Candidatus Accumulibacter meliphilus]|jgi:predicted phosphodiesterase|uniref:Calcineurin-like phosphoesterase domain-containing protein n=1 Tax=Candidatus Accumulibacter meliphilus TaxID=2211374 RepID=A0A369XTX9_9PROT|nr:MAG: hypothetical protein DVS81_04500 [Candidatus Accumulibacter meliphilus]
MPKELTWLHISDIHFCPHTEWRDSLSRGELLDYLKTHFTTSEWPQPDLIFCTGDIAFGHSSKQPITEQYSVAEQFFDKLLDVCGSEGTSLPRERLFIVPGNHDVNRDAINGDAQSALKTWARDSWAHVGEINQRFNDKSTEFLDTIRRLNEYGEFIKRYLPHLSDPGQRHVYAKTFEINGISIGVFGFNSAWTCAGLEDDRNIWLAAEWQFNTAKKELQDSEVRIGLMHHPIDWLNQTERELTNRRVASDFDFWLHGHSHNAWVTPIQSHIVIAAGAVGAGSSDEFGVNLCKISLSDNTGAARLHAKKAGASGWTIMPIEEVAPAGLWRFDLPLRLRKSPNNPEAHQSNNKTNVPQDPAPFDYIARYLSSEFERALKSFSGQPRVWVEPILSRKAEIEKDAKLEPPVTAAELVNSIASIIIKAPPQYGLTCLAKYLAKLAWHKPSREFWLYLDAKLLRPNSASINTETERVLGPLNLSFQDIRRVVLDSWSPTEKEGPKLLIKIIEIFGETPIICMQRSDASMAERLSNIDLRRTFETYFLWTLPREVIRKIVSGYNEARQIGDDDAVTKRLVSDLEVLNLHRTPLNCLTLLKVSEFDFDESPVNRTEMLKRVLFLLFNTDGIPTYKSKPDLKDSEHVLGYFCELLIREGSYFFTQNRFLLEVQRFCKDSLIDLDTHIVFDVLYKNNILLMHGSQFYFRFSYWIFYFVAQRMHHNEAFAKYILSEMRYAQYPEIIEFYTGADRKRDDALQVIINDLGECYRTVKENCGFPENLDPYKHATWESSPETQEKMHEVITKGVMDSNLPAEIKDQFADRTYDPARPYDQTIANILTEHSVVCLMKLISAAARALRNSDYAAPETKRQLLTAIMRSWDQLSKIVLVIAPELAEAGHASYDNAKFFLVGDFGKNRNERLGAILSVIPYNIAAWHQDDLYSPKMGPLLFDQLDSPDLSSIARHELLVLLILQRPRNWSKHVENYIASVAKNAFYLNDVFELLRHEYRYGFALPDTLSEIERLIKMSLVKHLTGQKRPGVKSIAKTSFKKTLLPERPL